MAVYTKINQTEIRIIEKRFNIGKILGFSGIKKGIENTNYLIKTKRKKYILTIFEKRVDSKELPFFMKLMYGLSKLKIKCPEPLKSINGKYLIKLKNKNACIVSFLNGTDKKSLSPKDCYIVGKNIARLHNASKKLRLYRKNTLAVPNLTFAPANFNSSVPFSSYSIVASEASVPFTPPPNPSLVSSGTITSPEPLGLKIISPLLLVEDNEMNRDMLSRRLMRKGFEVVMAEDGQKGVDMSISENPDLILMDLRNKKVTGKEVEELLGSVNITVNKNSISRLPNSRRIKNIRL